MTTHAPLAQTYPLKPLWFGLLAGPLSWTLHLMGSYTLVTLACVNDFANFTLFDFAGINALILGVTLVAALVVLAAGVTAYRHWQQLEGNLAEGVKNVPQFMALLGILSSGLFFTTILVAGLPAVYLHPCL